MPRSRPKLPVRSSNSANEGGPITTPANVTKPDAPVTLPAVPGRRQSRDFRELDTVPADCRRAEQQRKQQDCLDRPLRCRQRHCDAAGARQPSDQHQDVTRREQPIGDITPSDAPRDASDGRRRQREPRRHQRPVQRFGQVHDQEAREAHLGCRIRERHERKLASTAATGAAIASGAKMPANENPRRGWRSASSSCANRLRDAEHERARKRDHRECGAPADRKGQCRQQRAGQRGACGHPRLLDRERQRHSRRRGCPLQQVRRSRRHRARSRCRSRQPPRREQRGCVGGRRRHRVHADRTEHHARLRHANRAVALDEPAARQAREHRAGVDDADEHADPARLARRIPARARARAPRSRWRRTRRRPGSSASRRARPAPCARASCRGARARHAAVRAGFHAGVRAQPSIRCSVTMQSTAMSCGAAGTALDDLRFESAGDARRGGRQ